MMNTIEAKHWVKEKLSTFTVAKQGYLPKVNTSNTRKAISMGFDRLAFRTNVDRQWSANIPAKTSFEQLFIRRSDGKIFTLIGNVLTDWANRFDANSERIYL